MSDHFAAFSFVDRITEFAPGAHARGWYAVPRELQQELGRLTVGLRPLRITRAALAKSR